MFNVINPNGRDLVAVGSGTRVDLGQQNRMKECMTNEPQEWKDWLHNVRLELNRSGIDWSLHLEKMLLLKKLKSLSFEIVLTVFLHISNISGEYLFNSFKKEWLLNKKIPEFQK